jgi:hypothetical protein
MVSLERKATAEQHPHFNMNVTPGMDPFLSLACLNLHMVSLAKMICRGSFYLAWKD